MNTNQWFNELFDDIFRIFRFLRPLDYNFKFAMNRRSRRRKKTPRKLITMLMSENQTEKVLELRNHLNDSDDWEDKQMRSSIKQMVDEEEHKRKLAIRIFIIIISISSFDGRKKLLFSSENK